MRILPVISVVLIVAGLVLILYADPVLTSTATQPATQSQQTVTRIGTLGGNGTSSLPSGCHPGANGGIICGGSPGGGNGEWLTLIGTALLAAAIIANLVEAVSREPRLGPMPVS